MSEETTIWLSLRFQKLKFRQYTKELKKLSNANEIAVCICFVWDVKLGSEWWKEKKNHTLQSLLKSSCPWFSPNFSLRKRLDRNIPTRPLWNTIPHQHIHSFESVLLLLTVCEFDIISIVSERESELKKTYIVKRRYDALQVSVRQQHDTLNWREPIW